MKDVDGPVYSSTTNRLAGPPLMYPVPVTADRLHNQPIRTAVVHA